MLQLLHIHLCAPILETTTTIDTVHSKCTYYVHVHTHTYMYVHTHTYVYILIHVHTHTCTYIHMYLHIHVHTHTCTYTYMYIHIHVCTCTHAYTNAGPCFAVGEVQGLRALTYVDVLGMRSGCTQYGIWIL